MKKSFSAWRKKVNDAIKQDQSDPPLLAFRANDDDEFVEIDIGELERPAAGIYRATMKDGTALECKNDDTRQSNPIMSGIAQITRGYDTLLQSSRVHVEAVSTRHERLERKLLAVEDERDNLREEARKLKIELQEAKESFLDEEFVNLMVQLATVLTGRARDEKACELIEQILDSLPEETQDAVEKHAGPELLRRLATIVRGGNPNAH
jgi:hypothetical protein